MPLAFQTIDRGSIAFGFFNIESDMLLLQQYFFFADTFCRYISTCADTERWNPVEKFTVYQISNPENIGDLMGAINGIRYSGFIGETYRRFPFPDNPAHFKQNPFGFKTQDCCKEMITPYSEIVEIPFLRLKNSCVRIGEYTFDRENFYELLRYVSRGGFPQWLNNIAPDYVNTMRAKINNNINDFFSALEFTT